MIRRTPEDPIDVSQIRAFAGMTRWVSRKGRRHKALGIVLVRIIQDLFGASLLHQAAILHHHDVVGHGAHNREIVADEQVGQIVPAAGRAKDR